MNKLLDSSGLSYLLGKLKTLLLGKADKTNGIYQVKGTQTATTASWTGNIDVDALWDGLTIAYYLPRTSASNVTLNLTLKDGTTTGAVPVYVTSTTRMTTHYGAGSTVFLTYWSAGSILVNGTATTENRWTTSDYWNSNTIGEYAGSCAAGPNGMFRYSLIMQIDESHWESLVLSSGTGTAKAKNSSGFLITSPILYQSAGSYASGSLAGQSACWTTASFDTRYSTNGGQFSAAGSPFYLVGTITDGKFYLNTTWWADELPSTGDGYYYWYVGQMYSAYQCTLYPMHPIYYYDDGIQVLVPGVVSDANTVNGHTVQSDVPANAKFTDTTYESKPAVSGGTDVSLVTTGEKYQWNQNTPTTYTFEGGTNKFTVTPSNGSPQNVDVTPSIANNITGSGTRTNNYIAKFSGSNTITNGPAIGSDTTKYLRNDGNWAVPVGTTYDAVTYNANGLSRADMYRRMYNMDTDGVQRGSDYSGGDYSWRVYMTDANGAPAWRNNTADYSHGGLFGANNYRFLMNYESDGTRTNTGRHFYGCNASGTPGWYDYTATTSLPGWMSAADKTKLDGISVEYIAAGTKSSVANNTRTAITSHKVTTAGDYFVFGTITNSNTTATGYLRGVINTVTTGWGTCYSQTANTAQQSTVTCFYAYQNVAANTTFYLLGLQTSGAARDLLYNFGVIKIG